MLSSRSFKPLVLGFALLAGGCDRGGDQAAQPAAQGAAQTADKLDRGHKGEPIPELALKDASGADVSLASFKGRPLLVNLWATWCAPCIAELPTLNAIANRADMNVKVLTVSQDMEGGDKVQGFLDQHGFAQLPAVIDRDGELAAHYKVTTLPTSILYDAQGQEVWRYTGGNEWTSAEARKLLAEAK